MEEGPRLKYSLHYSLFKAPWTDSESYRVVIPMRGDAILYSLTGRNATFLYTTYPVPVSSI